MMFEVKLLIALIIAYLLGSISTAIVVSKIARTPDPREESSQNPGASNMLRIAGVKYAILTLIGDALKGFIAVILGLLIINVHGIGLGLIALAAVAGHMFPIYFKFHGGKGVATTLGALLALSPLLGLFTIIIWGVIAGITRYASLASLISSIAMPFIALGVDRPGYFIGLAIITILIILRHRSNIQRLCNGTEKRLLAKDDQQVAEQDSDNSG